MRCRLSGAPQGGINASVTDPPVPPTAGLVATVTLSLVPGGSQGVLQGPMLRVHSSTWLHATPSESLPAVAPAPPTPGANGKNSGLVFTGVTINYKRKCVPQGLGLPALLQPCSPGL